MNVRTKIIIKLYVVYHGAPVFYGKAELSISYDYSTVYE